MASLLLYQVADPKIVPGLPEALEELKSHTKVTVRTAEVPAVAGELAGWATEILVSIPVQALVNAATLGVVLWKIIGLIRKAGKKTFLGKEIVLPLLASKAKEDFGEDLLNDEENPDAIRVWGPMEAEMISGPLTECIEEYEEAFGPIAYFMAIAVARPQNRVRTTYYILGAGGKLCGSWTTQTFSERVPEFLRPG